MQATLMPLDGSEPIRLHKDVTVVGRKRGVCDLLVDRTSVSKLHCLIVKTDGLLFIRDLGSTNGTKVNGQRVTRGALLPGDELAFANAQFRVDLRPDAPPDDEESDDGATEMMSGPPHEAAASFQDADSESDVRLLPDGDSDI